jgi:hypothetical protein
MSELISGQILTYLRLAHLLTNHRVIRSLDQGTFWCAVHVQFWDNQLCLHFEKLVDFHLLVWLGLPWFSTKSQGQVLPMICLQIELNKIRKHFLVDIVPAREKQTVMVLGEGVIFAPD